MIRDVHPGFRIRILIFYPSRIRIQESKRHRTPDPDPQHWQGGTGYLIWRSARLSASDSAPFQAASVVPYSGPAHGKTNEKSDPDQGAQRGLLLFSIRQPDPGLGLS